MRYGEQVKMFRLSPTETKILEQLQIMDVPTIAKNLRISENTVYQHLKNVRRKYKEAKTFSNTIDSRYRSKSSVRKYLWTKEFQ